MSRSQQDIDTDMRRLRRMLDRVLNGDRGRDAGKGRGKSRRKRKRSPKGALPGHPALPAVPSADGDSPTRILDIACGACDEADTLTDYFSKLKSGANAGSELAPEEIREVELTGIDVRAREIADAQRRFRSARDPQEGSQAKFEFLNGDATKIDGHRELGEDFDVVFLRHQNLWNGRRTWEEIFDKALQKLDDDGRLIITSYFDREHELAVEAIRQLGGKLIATERNPDSRELVTPGKSIDRHVAVFRKDTGA